MKFRAVVMNDAHLRSAREDFGASREKLKAAVAMAAGWSPRPEVVVTLGDMTQAPDAEQLGEVRRLLAPLEPAAFLHVPGNHEIGNCGQAEEEAIWRAARGDLRRAVEHKGVLLVGLDNAHGDRPGVAAVAERNAWLRDVLERHRGMPKVIFCHVPLVPMRDAMTLRESFCFLTWKTLDRKNSLLGILGEQARGILAVVSGHVHLSGMVEAGGLRHVSVSGTWSWPGDVLRLDFYDDRLEIAHVAAEPFLESNDFAQFDLQNAVHDRHGSGIEFTDAGHPDFRSYVRGREEERRIVLKYDRARPGPGEVVEGRR